MKPIPRLYTRTAAPTTAPVTDHRLTLTDASWAIWRWSALRSAGFPVEHVLQLGAPECVVHAAEVMRSQAGWQAAQEDIVHLLKEYFHTLPDEQRPRITKLITAIRAGKPIKEFVLPAHIQAALTQYQHVHDDYAATCSTFQQMFAEVMAAKSALLRQMVDEPRFREALTWQNRKILDTAVASFISKPTTTTNDQYRKHRAALAKYLQRYTVKNDTIGFFGPVAWVQWQNDSAAMTMQPGTTLLNQRITYLESWGINRLAEKLAENTDLLPWAIPRRLPFVHVAGTLLKVPFAPPIRISQAQARVLLACDGTTNAHDIAQNLLREAIPGITSPADIFAIMHQLATMRRITWSFAVSQEDLFPDHTLQHHLERIGDATLRALALAPLARLQAGFAAINQAQGDPERLEHAIENYEALFTELTGQASTRSAGKLYAGRTMVFEECRRDVTVTFSREMLQSFAPTLALLLTSARWFVAQSTQRFRTYAGQVYQELSQKQHSNQVDFAEFYASISSVMFDENVPQPAFVTSLVAEFHHKWAEVLELDATRSDYTYTSAGLAASVASTFASAPASWPEGRFHCPDIMLAATDIAAINRQDYQIVLGEVHIGINTLDAPVFVTNQELPNALQQAIANDMPRPRVIPLLAEQIMQGNRLQSILAQPKDYRLLTTADIPRWQSPNVLHTSDLVVEDVSGMLRIRSRDGKLDFDILDVFSYYLSLFAANSFNILAAAPHRPRITIDHVVVTRESWRFSADAADFPFISETEPAASFLGVCRWVQSQGMPRFTFFRTNLEKKPFFIDFTSPISVEVFVKEVRRMLASDKPDSFISLSEMLPTPDHLWLTDAQGNHYTSEIRMAAVDLHAVENHVVQR